ncbi:hypothetical protein IMSHALPRED_002517 [Imshaugia aleurites]|uniref:Uncharacterized protein n=1 Tax=Imshaugia aleurites TaxID=172621 RepID=A0A8H3J687_9LECA|nr:hypothetical protein IMSHALPRED_002517 [Imshaugia aleurites]
MAPSFLEYPPEIREQIYGDILSTTNSRVESDNPDEPAHYEYQLAILRTCHQVYREAKKVFQDNVFIKITTPWPQAIEHIRSEGKVASVTTGERAEVFRDFHLWAFIDAPGAPFAHHHGRFSMLISLEDLEAFNQFWHYSNLNNYGLNQHLRLKLTIQDPHVPDRKIPKALQNRLLMPFGMIKNLNTFEVHGSKLLPSVDEALKKEQAIPDPTPEQCLEKGFALKDDGNALLKLGSYRKALQKYVESFGAIHIHVSGRVRIVHCDGFYVRDLTSGTYKGQRGEYARMILRVQLVSNIVLTYLKLEDFVEAHYWGKRSIILFRLSVTGEENDEFGDNVEEWLTQALAVRFPAHEAMGKICYRTALASRALGKVAEVKTLMKAAGLLLPRDEIVQREVQALEST